MQQTLLVLNAGSSSLKFALFQVDTKHIIEEAAHGEIDGLGSEQSHFSAYNAEEKILFAPINLTATNFKNPQFDSHAWALDILFNWLQQQSQYSICAAGHRVVHGGEDFILPTVVNPKVISQLEQYIPLAPLHQPYNLAGMRALAKQQPSLFQVACFDTAFHVDQPWVAQAFALPKTTAPLAIKRYGFHGLSYEYINGVLPNYLGDKATDKIIVAHLGNGASLCAIHNGKSTATTMGLTALDGLVMGTRCGNLDPGVILYLLTTMKMSVEEVTDLLYHRSGLLGISGISSDMRTLLTELTDNQNQAAKQAIDIFLYRFQRELGSLVAALGGIDSLVFTAGIGEHAAFIREKACADAAWLGIKLDKDANENNAVKISAADSAVSVWVIPTNEELMVAQHTWNLFKTQTSTSF